MFLIPESEHVTYSLKPMNCPNAMTVFNLKTRSYRDLPYRLSCCDTVHRKELSGTLHGLLRVQVITQDDAHIFCQEDQINEVYQSIFDICDLFYDIFGLTYKLRLGTKPAKYVGDNESWDKAETTLKAILEERVGPDGYWVEEGDGAFYGPKIDIVMYDALGREWQMGTLQLDFQLARRFNCQYVTKEGDKKHPIVVHRVIYGSLERFIGLLIEHTAGAFPLWLSPVQVMIVPVQSDFLGYAQKIGQQLRQVRIRYEIIDEESSLSAKVRKAQTGHTPVVLVVGGKEQESQTASVRLRGVGEMGAVPIEKLITDLQKEIASRALKLEGLEKALKG